MLPVLHFYYLVVTTAIFICWRPFLYGHTLASWIVYPLLIVGISYAMAWTYAEFQR